MFQNYEEALNEAMMRDAFTAGIEPGGLTSGVEIRMLVCYLLDAVKKPLSFEQINDALQSEGLVNYFELALAVSRLAASAHIDESETGDGVRMLSITELGSRAAATFEKSIPLSVREKALRSVRKKLLRERLEKQNSVKVEKTSDGYQVSFSIADVGTDLLNLSLFVPTKDYGDEIRERFLKDPTVIYRQIVAILTGEVLPDGGLGDEEN